MFFKNYNKTAVYHSTVHLTLSQKQDRKKPWYNYQIVISINLYQQTLNSQPHMFLFKLGKEKLKYKLFMTLHKVKYEGSVNLQTGWIFKIQVIRYLRGSHELVFTTEPVKKAEIKCKKNMQTVPMTLYYDNAEQTFLQKDMQIKGYLMNDLEEVESDLGKVSLNISQYINENSANTFVLQVQLMDDKNKPTVIKFHVSIEKQDDDSKSVQTSETTNKSSKGGAQDIKIKPGNYLLKPLSESRSSSRQEMSSKNTPPKIVEAPKTQNPRSRGEPAKIDKKSPPLDNTLKRQKDKSKEKQSSLFDMQALSKRQKTYDDDDDQDAKTVENKSQKKPTSSKRPPLPEKNAKQMLKQQNSSESLELRLFIAEKSLRQKERQLLLAKRQVQEQKRVIQNLLEEQHRQLKSNEAKKYLNQIESIKKQLLQANIKISELETVNRHYEQHEQQNTKLIQRQAKQVIYYKELLQKQKMRVARVVQKTLQTGDYDLITFIQEQLGSDKGD